jgi:hypothetical protein
VRVTAGEVREVCAATVSGVLMYFNGVETEELCTKLDADRPGNVDGFESLPHHAARDRRTSQEMPHEQSGGNAAQRTHPGIIEGDAAQIDAEGVGCGGVSIDEVVRDAKARQEAIGTYQGEQRKLFEAQWARKAEENPSDTG